MPNTRKAKKNPTTTGGTARGAKQKGQRNAKHPTTSESQSLGANGSTHDQADHNIDWVTLMEPVARRLLGEDNINVDQSNETELRFGRHGSMSVNILKGVWKDWENDEGGGPRKLIERERPDEDPIAWLQSEGLLNGDARSNAKQQTKSKKPKSQFVTAYNYEDENGILLFQQVRYNPKAFKQRRPGDHGEWIWNLGDVRRVLYRLPQLLKSEEEVVAILEGEKDTDNCVYKLGMTATTCPGGANKWRSEYNQYFAAKIVYIFPHNDAAGRKHAATLAANLHPIAKEVRIIELPGLDEKGDISDWIAAGGTKDALLKLIEATPKWEQQQAPSDSPAQDTLLLDPYDPISSARALVAKSFMLDKVRTLHRHRGAFWSWTGAYFRLADDEMIKLLIWIFLENAKAEAMNKNTKKKFIVPFKPNQSKVSNVVSALEAVTQCDKSIEPPAWLTRVSELPANEFMACGNGLLHLPSGKLMTPTPDFFNLSASEVEFDPNAKEPVQWLSFLDQLFDKDVEAKELLQEWFGYNLSPDTSQQKILMIVGPRRSGKGTKARTLTNLVGRDSVAGPTMSSLSEHFGLEPLIPKPTAIISDARIGARTDKSAVVERLLSISGEDSLDVPRKFKLAWTGRLPSRFMILTNELPALNDGSGALAGRLMVLVLTKSFFGKEDPALSNKLATELPGILNWALEGYRRLQKRGHFIQPKSSQEAINEIEMLASPVKAFITECCAVGPKMTVSVDDLWIEYTLWCDREGRKDPGNKQWFGRNLRSAVPGIKVSKPHSGKPRPGKPNSGKARVLSYQGIGLNTEATKAAAEAAKKVQTAVGSRRQM